MCGTTGALEPFDQSGPLAQPGACPCHRSTARSRRRTGPASRRRCRGPAGPPASRRPISSPPWTACSAVQAGAEGTDSGHDQAVGGQHPGRGDAVSSTSAPTRSSARTAERTLPLPVVEHDHPAAHPGLPPRAVLRLVAACTVEPRHHGGRDGSTRTAPGRVASGDRPGQHADARQVARTPSRSSRDLRPAAARPARAPRRARSPDVRVGASSRADHGRAARIQVRARGPDRCRGSRPASAAAPARPDPERARPAGRGRRAGRRRSQPPRHRMAAEQRDVVGAATPGPARAHAWLAGTTRVQDSPGTTVDRDQSVTGPGLGRGAARRRSRTRAREPGSAGGSGRAGRPGCAGFGVMRGWSCDAYRLPLVLGTPRSRVRGDRGPQRPGQRLELRLHDVVGVATGQHPDVEGDPA